MRTKENKEIEEAEGALGRNRTIEDKRSKEGKKRTKRGQKEDNAEHNRTNEDKRAKEE
jgi:hypothetical protein